MSRSVSNCRTLATQPRELLALSAHQPFFAGQWLAGVDRGLCDPIADCLRGAREFPSKLRGVTTDGNQLDHLLPKLSKRPAKSCCQWQDG